MRSLPSVRVLVVVASLVAGLGSPVSSAPSPAATPIYGAFGEFPVPPAPPFAIHVRSLSADVDHTGEYAVTAECHTGEVVVGGGFEIGTRVARGQASLTGSMPSLTNGWTVTALGDTERS